MWENPEYRDKMLKILPESRKQKGGYKVSYETRNKMSKSHQGKHIGNKNPMYGVIGELNPNYGRKMTKEQKQNISEKALERYKNGAINPMFGKHHTDETKKKISNANKGRKLTEEQKQKISQAQTGMKKRPYQKRKYHCICQSCNKEFLGNSHNQRFCNDCKNGGDLN